MFENKKYYLMSNVIINDCTSEYLTVEELYRLPYSDRTYEISLHHGDIIEHVTNIIKKGKYYKLNDACYGVDTIIDADMFAQLMEVNYTSLNKLLEQIVCSIDERYKRY